MENDKRVTGDFLIRRITQLGIGHLHAIEHLVHSVGQGQKEKRIVKLEIKYKKEKYMYTVSLKLVLVSVFNSELGKEDVGNREMAQTLRDLEDLEQNVSQLNGDLQKRWATVYTALQAVTAHV